MADNIKKTVTLTIVAVIAALCMATSAAAGPTWMEGVVTSAPEEGRVRRLGVNDIDYILMREVHVTRRYEIRGGAFQDEEISFTDIVEGDQVEIRRQGFRIYEIVVVE